MLSDGILISLRQMQLNTKPITMWWEKTPAGVQLVKLGKYDWPLEKSRYLNTS